MTPGLYGLSNDQELVHSKSKSILKNVTFLHLSVDVKVTYLESPKQAKLIYISFSVLDYLLSRIL